jgi:hypothetical protein
LRPAALPAEVLALQIHPKVDGDVVLGGEEEVVEAVGVEIDEAEGGIVGGDAVREDGGFGAAVVVDVAGDFTGFRRKRKR